ncbi:PepSY-like domain-containing protein [Brachyspira catarrhinii]|uniref:Putative beta-lactamase-inhibitor-like PepSY-like domain-containing protein n=1 Tax=Brachyspira catarrhinii TaxID=2528966 RepID=A0ABY2TU61_9SPIR|nr:PepSY-like domain-containing protein [Brachyspira catarrhinii]TKZ36440.1 hypothetical protein EZH24_00030 [Brachyspira catarrhinii]
MIKLRKIFILSIALLFASVLFADMVVPVSALPQSARSFIQNTFPNAQIFKVEGDDGKFKAKLNNGIEIKFLPNGEWESIDSDYTPIPPTVLPNAVQNTVKNSYPQALITDVEKEFGNYKIKLNNMTELFISSSGQLIGQKMDD